MPRIQLWLISFNPYLIPIGKETFILKITYECAENTIMVDGNSTMNITCSETGTLSVCNFIQQKCVVCRVTCSASAQRWRGDGFNSRLKTLKVYLLLLYQMGDINNMSRRNDLATNRRTSVPCTVRQRSCNQRVG